jgi:hypothetical protein
MVLCCLKGALEEVYGSRPMGKLNVERYCDADWASFPDDKRQTSCFCVFVGGKLVS